MKIIDKNDTKFMFPEIKDIVDKYCVSYEVEITPPFGLEFTLFIKTPIVVRPVKIFVLQKDNPLKGLTAFDFLFKIEEIIEDFDDDEENADLIKNMCNINECTTVKEIIDSVQFQFDTLEKFLDDLADRLFPYCKANSEDSDFKIQQFRMEV